MTTATLIKKTFISWSLLTVQRFSPSWREAWWQGGRHGPGNTAQSPTSHKEKEAD